MITKRNYLILKFIRENAPVTRPKDIEDLYGFNPWPMISRLNHQHGCFKKNPRQCMGYTGLSEIGEAAYQLGKAIHG